MLGTSAAEMDKLDVGATAILTLSAVFAVTCYTLELRRSMRTVSLLRWLILVSRLAHWGGAGIVLLRMLFHYYSQATSRTKNECGSQPSINPDIGGIGVRVGLYIPTLLTLLSMVLGRYCGKEIGTKELGAAQVINLSYITLNLLKALRHFDDLTFVEVVIICMCIDGVCACISMTMSDKTALASRWYVKIAIGIQMAAFTTMLVALGLLARRPQQSSCCNVYWWGALSSCEQPPYAIIMPYLVLRLGTFFHTSWLGLQHMGVYDKQQKLAEVTGEANSFSRSPATTFSKWWEMTPFALLAIVSIEWTVSAQAAGSGSMSDWGQSAALIAAIAGTSHWLYVLWRSAWPGTKTISKDFLEEWWRQIISCFQDDLFRVDLARLRASEIKVSNRTANDLGKALLLSVTKFDVRGLKITLEEIRGRTDIDVDWCNDGRGESALWTAVDRDNMDAVRELLAAEANPRSAMILAAKSGQALAMEELLKTFDCQRYSTSLLVTFSKAVEYDQQEVLKPLLDSIPRDGDGRSFSRLASRTDETGRPQLFLREIEDTVRVEDEGMLTLVSHAVSFGAKNVVKSLLQGNTGRGSLTNDRKLSTLFLAIRSNHWDIVKLFNDDARLLGYAAPRISHNQALMSAFLANDQVEVERLSVLGGTEERFGDQTALQIAAGRGLEGTVEMLIAAGANVNAGAVADDDDFTPLTFLQAAVERDQHVVETKSFGYPTALQEAAESGHLGIVERLLAAGAIVDATAGPWDSRDLTALRLAAESGHVAVVEQLITAGANVNTESTEGRTALQAAAEGGHLTVVDQLITAGANVNAPAGYYGGRTALQAAAEGDHLTVVDSLIAAGANVNAAAAD